MMSSYYVDSCVYLNLWYDNDYDKHQIAKSFFQNTKSRGNVIYYSGFVLKEIRNYINTRFQTKRLMFDNAKFIMLQINNEEYETAKDLEAKFKYEISFYDIIHTLLAKRKGAILITNDNKLIHHARRMNVDAYKPEQVL